MSQPISNATAQNDGPSSSGATPELDLRRTRSNANPPSLSNTTIPHASTSSSSSKETPEFDLRRTRSNANTQTNPIKSNNDVNNNNAHKTQSPMSASPTKKEGFFSSIFSVQKKKTSGKGKPLLPTQILGDQKSNTSGPKKS